MVSHSPRARFAEAGSGFLGDLLAAVPSSNYSGNTNSPWVIQAYDANGNSVGPFTTINFPTGATTTTVGAMALAPDGNVYVGEYYGVNNGGPGNAVGLVQEFNGTTGAFIKTIVPGGSGGLGAPTGLAFDGQGTIYALDRNPTNGTTGAINEYSASTGTFLRRLPFRHSMLSRGRLRSAWSTPMVSFSSRAEVSRPRFSFRRQSKC